MASSAKLEIRPAAANRRLPSMFFRFTVGLIALWTIATLLWVLDPAFLVHAGNLLAQVFRPAVTRA